MITAKIKEKKCKICGVKFTPSRPFQTWCSTEHAYLIAKAAKEKSEKKKWVVDKKAIGEKIKTTNEWKKYLEHEINKLVRIIDYGHPCLSCGRYGKPQAGHYHSVKANPTIRFNLFNIFIQDYYCNVQLSANIIGYNIGLINTFGKGIKEYVESDIVRLYPTLILGIHEIREKIALVRKINASMPPEKIYPTEERIEIRRVLNEQIGLYK